MPGDGGVPARFKLASAWAMIRSSAGSELASDSLSAFASRFAVRNCALIMSNSDTRFVVRVNCSMNGRKSWSFFFSPARSSSGTNSSALAPIIFKSPL